MDNQQTNDQQRQSVEFLRTEYQYLGECFWRNEETGERRVNFLITLVTAVTAGLVTLATSKEGDFLQEGDVYLITVCALLALLLIGLVTLLRMIRRNKTTDRYKRAMNMIRGHFRDGGLQDYYPFGRDEEGKDKVGTRQQGTGGLVDLVSLINSLIAAALCALLSRSYSQLIMVTALSGFAGFAVASIIQFRYVKRRYEAKDE
ncbi:MAG: hypothetical protein ACE5OS_13360 [Anaerolineae bacterium]